MTFSPSFLLVSVSAHRPVEEGGELGWWSVKGPAASGSATTTVTSWTSPRTWSSATRSPARARRPGTADRGSRYASTTSFSSDTYLPQWWCVTVSRRGTCVLSVFVVSNGGAPGTECGRQPAPAHPDGPCSDMVLIRTHRNTLLLNLGDCQQHMDPISSKPLNQDSVVRCICWGVTLENIYFTSEAWSKCSVLLSLSSPCIQVHKCIFVYKS